MIMNDQRRVIQRTFPTPSICFVLLGMLCWCGPLVTAVCGANPYRVGECIVRLNLTCNGSAKSSVSSDGITVTSKDSFSGTVNSEIHYVVMQETPTYFATEDEISGQSSISVGGGGSSSIKSKDGSYSASWSYFTDPDFDTTIAFASGTIESGSDPDLTPQA